MSKKMVLKFWLEKEVFAILVAILNQISPGVWGLGLGVVVK